MDEAEIDMEIITAVSLGGVASGAGDSAEWAAG